VRMKELIKNVFLFGVIAMFGSFIRYIRQHRCEPFSLKTFAAGMLIAWFIGALTYCMTIPLGVHPVMAAGLAGAAGHCGGSLLDVTEEALEAAIKKLFKI